jgi:hypothetical protein
VPNGSVGDYVEGFARTRQLAVGVGILGTGGPARSQVCALQPPTAIRHGSLGGVDVLAHVHSNVRECNHTRSHHQPA